MKSNLNSNFQTKKEESSKTEKQKLDELYERTIDNQLENLLEDDDYYQMQATPLKSAEAIKVEHKQKIKEELEQKELREQITHAYDLILNRLPQMISPMEFDRLKEEFANSVDHFIEMSEKPQELLNQFTSLQEIYGISDESLKHIYALAYSLLENKDDKDAEAVFSLLILLNPSISFFWTALGMSLKNQSKLEEALGTFEIAQMLDPQDPSASILGAQCNIQLNKKDESKRQLADAEKILASSTIINRSELVNQIQYLKNQI